MQKTQIFFIMKKQVQFGQAIYLTFDFDGWDLTKAIKMDCQNINEWHKCIYVNVLNFQYKYLIGNYENIFGEQIIWEMGPNRKSDILEFSQVFYGKLELKDVWEKRKLLFYALEKLSKPIKVKEKHMILLFVSIRELNRPVRLDNFMLNQNIMLYIQEIYIDIYELETPIYLQIYLNLRIKSKRYEIIGKRIEINFTNQPLNLFQLFTNEMCFLTI